MRKKSLAFCPYPNQHESIRSSSVSLQAKAAGLQHHRRDLLDHGLDCETAVPFVILNASSPNQINAAFATIAEQHIEALLIGADGWFAAQSNQLAALTARYGVPAIYPYPEVAEAGGLISYGASIPTTFRLAGTYVGRILKGEKPADLPVQQSSHLDLVLNLKTAKALGLEIPAALLVRADEVIE